MMENLFFFKKNIFFVLLLVKCSSGHLQEKSMLKAKAEVFTVLNPLVLITGVSEYKTSPLPCVKLDTQAFYDLFYNFFGYTVKIPPNNNKLTFKEMQSFINEQNKMHHNYDALIFVFSGHGGDRKICLTDHSMCYNDITNAFNKSFVGLPKIFFKFACRGNKNAEIIDNKKAKNISDEDEELNEEKQQINTDAYKYKIFSTVEGKVALGGIKGSCCDPVKFLVDCFKKNWLQSDFQTIMSQVSFLSIKNDKRECMNNQYNVYLKTYFYKQGTIRKGLNIHGKCDNCDEIQVFNLGTDAKKYDKSKNAKSYIFEIGRVSNKVFCYYCKQKLKPKFIYKFGMHGCSYSAEFTPVANYNKIKIRNLNKQEYKLFNYRDDFGGIIWSSCTLYIEN